MGNWYPVRKKGANKTYSSQQGCEAKEGQVCYEITDKDLRYHTLQEVQIGEDENQVPIMETQLVEDVALKATVEAEDIALAASENLIKDKLKNMDFGKRVLALVSIRNDAKTLSTVNVASISATYAPIQALLLSGSIATAKNQILSIVPDGTLVTQADLDAIVAEINSYLGV